MRDDGSMRGAHLLFLIVVTMLLLVASAWADGPVGSDPVNNFPLGGMPEACVSEPDGAVCQNAAIYYLDAARASLGQPAYALPADFTGLSPVDQDLILTDLDRTLYGLPAVPGLTAALNADADNGVTVDDDPRFSDPHLIEGTSNWAGAFFNLEAAYEAWMYDDGAGSGNGDCTPSNMTGCWGHRHDILWSFSGSGALAMGAAAGLDSSGARGYAMLLGMGDSSYSPTYTDTWAAAQADGAGAHAYSPGTPQMTVEVVMEGAAGTVSDSHGQVCSSGSCSFAEPVGQPVALTAAPQSGSVFDEWLGACSGSGTCTITPEQSETLIGAYFTSASGTGSSGPGGLGGAPGLGGSPSLGGSPGSSAPGAGATTGTPRVVKPPRVLRLITSRATIHAELVGSHLVCKLARWRGHSWGRARIERCGASVTYRHLTAGRYRLTVVSAKTSVARIVTLRHGVSNAVHKAPHGGPSTPVAHGLS